MAIILNCSIDLSKIDKSKIIEGKKGGKYYNFTVVVNDEVDQYGNHAALSEAQTEEQRKAKEKRTFIGNGKKVWEGTNRAAAPQQAAPITKGQDLPF